MMYYAAELYLRDSPILFDAIHAKGSFRESYADWVDGGFETEYWVYTLIKANEQMLLQFVFAIFLCNAGAIKQDSPETVFSISDRLELFKERPYLRFMKWFQIKRKYMKS